MKLQKYKLLLFILTCLVYSNLFAYKLRPYVELSRAYYLPYLDVKNDFNLGLYYDDKVENYLGIGFGFENYFSFNIKETIVFKKRFLKYFEPLVTAQFRYNNFRPYNFDLDGTVTYVFACKNSLIAMVGLQVAIKKAKIKFQIQSGISYNFQEIDDSFVNNHSKNFNDIFFNSINSLGIIKVF